MQAVFGKNLLDASITFAGNIIVGKDLLQLTL